MATDDYAVDFRDYLPEVITRSDTRSAFLKAKVLAKDHVINPCRFCDKGDIDAMDIRGLCKHYAGMTLSGDDKHYHAMKKRAKKTKDAAGNIIESDVEEWDYLDGKHKLEVPKNAHLVRVSVSSRVYLPEPKPIKATVAKVAKPKKGKNKAPDQPVAEAAI